jgi:DNA-binding response OmpR family regulator
MKILIIEDDQIVANIYRNKFAHEGFEAEIARDGESGLELVRSFHPDVLLLDLALPGLSGLDVMRQVRAEKDFEKVPIVVFSNTYLTKTVQDAWKAGATKCLFKGGSTPRQVIDAVRAALKQSDTERLTNREKSTPQTKEVSAEDDLEFQDQLRREFIEGLPETLVSLRSVLQALIRADGEGARIKQIQELYRRAHSLSSNAGIAGTVDIALIADALEALIKELEDKPKNINASTLRTVASAIDCMSVLFGKTSPDDEPLSHADVLVVDDEAISRRAIAFAIEKAHMKCLCVEDPLKAVDVMLQKKFDLIFLDVDMPNMSGFELCTKIRTLPQYAKTPVVFVTGLNDLENRANSTVSGGNDFIAKPFLFIELTVKALVHVLRSRLATVKK